MANIIFIEPLYCRWVLSLIHITKCFEGKKKQYIQQSHLLEGSLRCISYAARGFGWAYISWWGVGGGGEEIRLVICKNSDWWSVISGVSKGPLQYLDRVFCLSHLSTIICHELSHLSTKHSFAEDAKWYIYYKKWYTCAKLKCHI